MLTLVAGYIAVHERHIFGMHALQIADVYKAMIFATIQKFCRSAPTISNGCKASLLFRKKGSKPHDPCPLMLLNLFRESSQLSSTQQNVKSGF